MVDLNNKIMPVSSLFKLGSRDKNRKKKSPDKETEMTKNDEPKKNNEQKKHIDEQA